MLLSPPKKKAAEGLRPAAFRVPVSPCRQVPTQMGVAWWPSWCVDAVPCQKHIGAGYCARTNGVQYLWGAREKSILACCKGTPPEIGGPGGYPPWRGPGAGPGWRDWEGRLASLPWLSGDSFSIERVTLGVRGAERPRIRKAGRRPARQKGGAAACPRPRQRATASRPREPLQRG